MPELCVFAGRRHRLSLLDDDSSQKRAELFRASAGMADPRFSRSENVVICFRRCIAEKNIVEYICGCGSFRNAARMTNGNDGRRKLKQCILLMQRES